MYTYRIVPGKCPYPDKRPPNFDSFVVFKVLRVATT